VLLFIKIQNRDKTMEYKYEKKLPEDINTLKSDIKVPSFTRIFTTPSTHLVRHPYLYPIIPPCLSTMWDMSDELLVFYPIWLSTTITLAYICQICLSTTHMKHTCHLFLSIIFEDCRKLVSALWIILKLVNAIVFHCLL